MFDWCFRTFCVKVPANGSVFDVRKGPEVPFCCLFVVKKCFFLCFMPFF